MSVYCPQSRRFILRCRLLACEMHPDLLWPLYIAASLDNFAVADPHQVYTTH
jgi:hypothetical protein